MYEKNVEGIEGLILISPKIFYDERGSLSIVYSFEDFSQNIKEIAFIQDNEVYNKKGVLRGMHVNLSHPQAKLLRVIKGAIFDVVVDLRKDSKTYMKAFSTVLSNENRKGIFIPEGFGHGYLSLTDNIVQFKISTDFIPGDEINFSWRSFNIEWPNIGVNYIMNNRDKNSPIFTEKC